MSSQTGSRSWTVRLRTRMSRTVPAGQILPDRQPAFVNSWIYVFGVACLAALVWVLASGIVLSIMGPVWWHTSSIGHFFNSTHLWSVELFFLFMAIHLWGKFFMASWRGNRGLTWVTGAVAFMGSLGTAFTGYLSQTNFDSQWTSTQAKDGLNSVAIGSVFNVLNTGQMLLWHVVLLPLVVGLLVALHIILVRRHGVVPPYDAVPPEAVPEDDSKADPVAAPRASTTDDKVPVPMARTGPLDAAEPEGVAQ